MAYKNIENHRDYHRKYMKQYRAELKRHKMCINCKAQDAWTMMGKNLCYECTVKRLGHEPIIRERKEKEPHIPRNEWYLYDLCYKCKRPVLQAEKRWTAGKIRLCEHCYNKILELAQTKRKKIIKPFNHSRRSDIIYRALKEGKDVRDVAKLIPIYSKANKKEYNKQCDLAEKILWGVK